MVLCFGLGRFQIFFVRCSLINIFTIYDNLEIWFTQVSVRRAISFVFTYLVVLALNKE